MSRRRRFRVTRATAATVARWATQGKRRVRKKYRGAVTACRILNRRELPLVGEHRGEFGRLLSVKMRWGEGPVRPHRTDPGVGWYGEWHVRHGRLGRPLHCLADLRRWVRDQPSGEVGLAYREGFRGGEVWTCDSGEESLRRLRGRSRPW